MNDLPQLMFCPFNRVSKLPKLMDRLSGLPDSIIIDILGLLPMREAVRTTILSKRWENLWTTTPYLNFEGHTLEFVKQALTLWRGSKVLKFKFDRVKESEFSDIDLWLCLTKENGVEDLYLDGYNNHPFPYDDPKESYCLPHDLYACSLLKVLWLRSCNIPIPHGNVVQWTQLRSLTIKKVYLDGYSIDKIVSNSPQLEVLILEPWDNDDNLSIRSSSLRKLKIINHKYCFLRTACSRYRELIIWTPNLETLDIGGMLFSKLSLLNVSSITELRLDLWSCPRDGFLEEILQQIFPTIQHVEKLTLTDCCIKALGAMKNTKYLWNSKLLKIQRLKIDYGNMMDLLECFPKLETLVFEEFDYGFFMVIEKGFIQVERNLPQWFLLQLSRVEISWREGVYMLPFIEFLLKHASKLQKMVIRVNETQPASNKEPLFLALQKVVGMPRSSPTADLIFSDSIAELIRCGSFN